MSGLISLTLLIVLALLSTAEAANPGPGAGYGHLPLSFVANHGQTDPGVAFIAEGKGYTLFLSPSEVTFVAQPPALVGGPSASRLRDPVGRQGGGDPRLDNAPRSVVRLQLLGAEPAPPMSGEEQTSSVNYLIGADRTRWRTGVPAYARVRSRGVYRGIDLVFYGNPRQFEYDFVLAPGADPRSIRLGFAGISESEGRPALHVDPQGDLVLGTTGGDLRLRKPLAYQEFGAARREVAARYVLRSSARDPAEVGIEVGAYDASRPLVIDPVLDYSTYLGGSGSDAGMAIAVDTTGHAYVAGFTESPDFPHTTGAVPPAGTRKAFVAKLNASGSGLVYATYLGGSGHDTATAIAIDAAGNAYVAGLTESADFPTLNGNQADQGGSDAFVAKLDPSGSSLLYSTYLGGGAADAALGVAVSGDMVYVTGYTESADFPRRSAFQRPAGGADAFVAKFDPALSGSASLIYSTLLGGSERDEGHAIAVDAAGNAHIAGFTESPNYPTRNPYQRDVTGPNAFATKLSAVGSTLHYSTYLAGAGIDVGLGIAIDAAGMMYVTGHTASADFPTKNPYQASLQGATDAFITKLNPAASGDSSLVASTYLGGSGADAGVTIAISADQRVYLAGYTDSTDFPTLNPALPDRGGRDAFVVKLDLGSASPLIYSTYVGGGGDDEAYGIALDPEGNAYITGLTRSADFPAVAAFATALGGSQDAFVARLADPGADLIVWIDVPGGVANSAAGATVTVSDWTRSESASPAGASTTSFYLVTGSTLDASAVLLGSRAIPALGPSTTDTGSTTLTLPASASGTFRIIAKADADNTVVEANEANNLSVASGAFTLGPDLIAWLDVPGASSTPATGATISVTDFVRNDSATPAPASTSRLLFSTTPTLDASAIVVGTRAIPALGPGEVSSGTITFALPAGHTGVRYLVARADATNAVTESNEFNNTSTRQSITIGTDLIVWIDVPGGVANSAAGATVTVTDFTRSDNSAPAGPSTTKFYLVTGTTLDASAVLLGSRAIPALGASTTNTGSTTLTLPASASGTFRIIAKADADNTVVEANEANNLSVASGAFTLGPDLIAWLDVPGASSTPATGATISVTDFVRNDSATSAPASTSRLLFSTTPTPGASAIVVGTRAIPALGPGEVSSGTITFALPAGHAGVRHLIAQADSTNAVTESSETNNLSAAKSISIGADLIVTLDVPGGVANSAAGATVTVTDFTRSDNSAPAGPSTTKFYLVTGTTLDASAVLLGSRAIPALGPSTTNTGSTVLTLPASASGTFRIIAKADADNTVVEANEANNLSVASGAFTLGPDLIAWLDVPGAFSTPATGATISVTDFVRNDSATPARASTSRLFFSTTPTLDASAIVVGTRAIPALGPGEVSSGTITFTLPAGHTGVRYLVARADATNAVTESNEFNNSSARQSITIGADLIVTIDVPGSVANSTAGATVTVTDFTRSDNSAPAGPSTTKFYLVTGTTLDASAVLLGSRAIPALGPSTTNTGSTVLTLPASASGTFRIIAKADADNTVVEANEANNLSVASGAFTLGPDLIAWLDVPGAFSTPATGATISVTDFVRNDSATPAPASTSRLLFSTTPTLDASAIVVGTRAIPALGPGEVSSGTITFTLPAGHAGVRYLVARADSSNAVTESNEFNNASARQSITIGADLIVTLDVPGGVANSVAGATVTVTDFTRSDNSAAAGPSTTKFYLVTGTTLDTSAVLLGSRAIPALGPSTTNTGSTVLTLPASANGTFRIIAKADADNTVVEANEANNLSVASGAFTVGPDLIAWLDVPAASSTPATGATISVTDFVRNDSATPARASTSRLLFSTTPTPGASAIVVGTRAIPALAPGEVSSGTITFALPAGHAGVRHLIAQADSTNAVTESSETNNLSAAKSISIGADLIVTLDVPGGVANSVAGATVTVTDFTRSDNSAPAGPSTTKFYLVTGTTLDASAVLLGSRALPALGPSTTNTGSTVLTLPASASGTFRIIAKADADNTVVEANEANNLSVASGAFTVGADLVAWLDVPAASSTPPAGATISVTDFVRNDSATSAPASTSRLLFSTTPTLDASAIVVGTRAIPALAPGEVSSGTITFALPAGHAGVRYLVARADATSAVTESNEFNNTSARKSITVGADLIITIDVPGSVATSTAGATVTVTDLTRSDNSAPADPSTTKFYLVRGTTLDASAVLLGSRAIPALGPSTTNTSATVLTLPASAVGTYRILAKADADDAVVEANEANNTAISSPFTLGADLVVSLDLPGSHALVAAGSTISITDFTQNRSAVAVGASRTNFYLSADAMFDAGDVPLGSRAIPALAAGAASTGATSLTLPGGIAGIYRIIAVADADGEVTEKNEANNVGVSSSFEIGPDLTVSGSTVTARAGAGATINVSDVTKNRGGAGAPASSTSIYLSANAVLGAGDRLLGSRAVPALAVGVFDSATTSVVIPLDVTAGSYFIIVGADSGGAMAESNEANNALAKPIEILPDLRVTAVTASSARAFPGTTISVGETTLNQGAAAGPSTTHFFLSTDGTIDAGDVFLGSRPVPALAAGGSNTGSIEVGIPPETPEGTYSIIAWSDAPGAIRELDEANNIRGRTVSVGPDLTVSLLVPPLSAAAGAAIAVTDTVLNRGSAAPASTMRFYLSRGTLRAPGDPEIGSRIVPALGLNATSRNSTTLTIPAGTPAGAYHVIAECDADDVVTELVETNNARARAITITQ